MRSKESLEVFKKYYLKEFCFFDGENDITFNITGIDFENKTIEVAVTNQGKISVIDYDLTEDKNGNFFFIYGANRDEINLNDFEEIKD